MIFYFSPSKVIDRSFRVVDMKKSKSKEMKELLSEKGRKYNCQECGKQMANKRSIYTHIRAVHQGVKYHCRQCLYQAKTKGSLDQHRKSVHEGLKYPCKECEYQATQ